MKRIIRTILAVLLVSAIASCNKAPLPKADVESGFDTPESVPTVELVSVVPDGMTATATLKVSDYASACKDSLKVGLMVATDATFAQSKFYEVEVTADGEYTLDFPVTPLSHSYFMACASNYSAWSYSSKVIDIELPDAPLIQKVVGSYTLNAVSEAYGDSYSNNVSIFVNPENPETVLVTNLEPWWYTQGAVYEKNGFNVYEAVLDDENNTLYVQAGPVAAGVVADWIYGGATEDGSVIITFDAACSKGQFADMYELDPSSGEAADLFSGTLTRN